MGNSQRDSHSLSSVENALQLLQLLSNEEELRVATAAERLGVLVDTIEYSDC